MAIQVLELAQRVIVAPQPSPSESGRPAVFEPLDCSCPALPEVTPKVCELEGWHEHISVGKEDERKRQGWVQAIAGSLLGGVVHVVVSAVLKLCCCAGRAASAIARRAVVPRAEVGQRVQARLPAAREVRDLEGSQAVEQRSAVADQLAILRGRRNGGAR